MSQRYHVTALVGCARSGGISPLRHGSAEPSGQAQMQHRVAQRLLVGELLHPDRREEITPALLAHALRAHILTDLPAHEGAAFTPFRHRGAEERMLSRSG
jgi:hypothetical protein